MKSSGSTLFTITRAPEGYSGSIESPITGMAKSTSDGRNYPLAVAGHNAIAVEAGELSANGSHRQEVGVKFFFFGGR